MCVRVVDVRKLRTPDQRAGVVYCGRAFAGWPASPWGNPFTKANSKNPVADFRTWFAKQENREQLLAELWERTEHGAKPLGCWCVNATAGDGSEVVCHAQILAELLRERFCSGGPN